MHCLPFNFVKSLERIHAYVKIEQEPKPTKEGIPPAYWPSSGDLRVENLSARYSSDGAKVLQNISFHVKSGERIGVGVLFVLRYQCSWRWLWTNNLVGRTGSGKVCLILPLSPVKYLSLIEHLSELLDVVPAKMHIRRWKSVLRWSWNSFP